MSSQGSRLPQRLEHSSELSQGESVGAEGAGCDLSTNSHLSLVHWLNESHRGPSLLLGQRDVLGVLKSE